MLLPEFISSPGCPSAPLTLTMNNGAVNDEIFNSVINGSAPYTLDIFTRDAKKRGIYNF